MPGYSDNYANRAGILNGTPHSADHVKSVYDALGDLDTSSDVKAQLDSILARLTNLEGTPVVPVEPSLMFTDAELDAVKAEVDSGTGPTYTFWNTYLGAGGFGGFAWGTDDPRNVDQLTLSKVNRTAPIGNYDFDPRRIDTTLEGGSYRLDYEFEAQQDWMIRVGYCMFACALRWRIDPTLTHTTLTENFGDVAVESINAWVTHFEGYTLKIPMTTMDGNCKLLTGWFLTNFAMTCYFVWDHPNFDSDLKSRVYDWLWNKWFVDQGTGQPTPYQRGTEFHYFNQKLTGWNGWMGMCSAAYHCGLLMKKIRPSDPNPDLIVQDAVWRLNNVLAEWVYFGAVGDATQSGGYYVGEKQWGDAVQRAHLNLGENYPQKPSTVDSSLTGGSTTNDSDSEMRNHFFYGASGTPWPNPPVGITQETGRSIGYACWGNAALMQMARSRRINGDIDMWDPAQLGPVLQSMMEMHSGITMEWVDDGKPGTYTPNEEGTYGYGFNWGNTGMTFDAGGDNMWSAAELGLLEGRRHYTLTQTQALVTHLRAGNEGNSGRRVWNHIVVPEFFATALEP